MPLDLYIKLGPYKFSLQASVTDTYDLSTAYILLYKLMEC